MEYTMPTIELGHNSFMATIVDEHGTAHVTAQWEVDGSLECAIVRAVMAEICAIGSMGCTVTVVTMAA